MIHAHLFALVLALAQGGGPPPQIIVPPTEAWSKVESRLVISEPTDGSVSVSIRLRTDTKQVKLGWRFYSNFPTLNTGIVSHTQVFTTRYWPTYACGNGEDSVLVAGQDIAGKTVIERWDFNMALLAPEAPAGFEPAPRATVTPLYSDDEPGRQIVLQMRPMLAAPHKVLVRFLDSRDVWIFDTVSTTWTQIAGPGPSEPSGVLVQAALSGKFGALSGRDHVSQGHVYIFGAPGSFVATNFVSVVLVDSDEDGDIDSTLALSNSAWASGAWSDPASYE